MPATLPVAETFEAAEVAVTFGVWATTFAATAAGRGRDIAGCPPVLRVSDPLDTAACSAAPEIKCILQPYKLPITF